MSSLQQRALWAVAFLSLLSGGCAHNLAYEPSDPLEPVNRQVYRFNITADKYLLRPVAVGYTKVVPSPLRRGVDNFFDNLYYPRVIVNDLLQGKLVQSGRDTGRLLLNTTVGLAGLVDVATPLGLTENDEDFGQTLGKWGVGEGWYLMIPLLGPSTNRDLVGTIADNWTDPLQYVDSVGAEDRIALNAAQIIDARSRYLDLDAILEEQIDPYVFVRTTYLQRRKGLVLDGDPPEEELDFGDDVPGTEPVAAPHDSP